MNETLSELGQNALDRVLSDLAGRLAGSVDFWTVVCLFPPDTGFDRRGFVEAQSQVVRGLLDQIEVLLTETAAVGDEHVRGRVDDLAGACHRLLDAFGVLVAFQTVPLEEVRQSIATLAEAYSAAQVSIQSLAQAVGVEVSFFAKRRPDQDEYIQGILRNLFPLFQEAWTTSQSTVPPSPRGLS
jgi:hypothetical protein